jgi:hypothetical protein
MHFHLPKPLHGWREFAGEVGIIVVGVLIALGAEQLVESWHWRKEVDQARSALGFELADSVGEGYEREHIYDCVEGRLDFLAATVDEAAATGRLPPLPFPESTPFRTWLDATWQTTMAGQVASHFDRRQLTVYGEIYGFVQNLQQLGPRELAVWSRLDAIAGPGRPITSEETVSLRNDIAEARLLNRLTTIAGMRLREAADKGAIPYDLAVAKAYANAPKSSFPLCVAMTSKPPEHYGSAGLAGAIEHVRNTPIVMLNK